MKKIQFLALLVIGLQYCVKAQVKADFRADITNGCSPLLVKFTNLSEGATTYYWDLGNSTNSVEKDPAVIYFKPGAFTIKLIAKDANGKETTITKTGYITVQKSPVIEFTSSVISGCSPVEVKFTDATDPQSGTSKSWLWDFGDGNTSTEQHPTHTYTGAGNYHVSLVATNTENCSSNLTKQDLVKLQSGVKADFSFIAQENCAPPSNITFTNTTTGTGTINYLWDFGDGKTSTDKNPTHTYQNVGKYTVKLVARNENGCTNEFISTKTVSINKATAAFTYDAIACVNTSVNFKDASELNPTSVSWNFGDGNTGTGKITQHTYRTPGTYRVTMKAVLGDCEVSTMHQVTVLPSPKAAFNTDKNIGCSAPFAVQFNDASEGDIGKWVWDFGDGTNDPTNNTSNPLHTYKVLGKFNTSLTVTDKNGCTSKITKPAHIQIQEPKLSISNVDMEGCLPLAYTPTPVVENSVSPIVKYEWDFGDGKTAEGKLPQHQYTTPGTFDVQLIVTTEAGCQYSITYPKAVRTGIEMPRDFIATPLSSCAETGVNFTQIGTGDPKDVWHFGDGGTFQGAEAHHRYSNIGYFDITLVTYNNGCRATTIKEKYVFIKAPIARFDQLAVDCATPYTRKFRDNSIGAETWQWDFGDGSTSNEVHPSHEYKANGTYTVRLTVTNETCSYTTEREVIIEVFEPDFSIATDESCKRVDVQFTAQGVQPVTGAIKTQWQFKNNTTGKTYTQAGTSNSFHYSFEESGHYDITLLAVSRFNCEYKTSRENVIEIFGPTAQFTTAEPQVCFNEALEFKDESVSDGIHPITSWVWTFENGSVQTVPTGAAIAHTYTTPGTKKASLTVIDSRGCSATVASAKTIIVANPKAVFTSTDPNTCDKKDISFTNNSTGSNLTYLWDFGNGTQSATRNPKANYTGDGTYDIKLTVTDQYGCTSTQSNKDYITIANPVADFELSDNFTACPPLLVQFQNKSTNYTSFKWDFGTQSAASTLEAPSHFYTKPNVYDVKLVVTSKGGCTATAIKKVTVEGPKGDMQYTAITGCSPVTVSLEALAEEGVAITWDYNDGIVDNAPKTTTTHTYREPGSYYPKMLLTNKEGCQVPVEAPDPIIVKTVEADFNLSNTIFCNEGTVALKALATGNDPIKTYTWTINNNAVRTGKDVIHHFEQPGVYAIQLDIESNIGCTSTIKKENLVIVSASPKIGIEGNLEACAPASFELTAALLESDGNKVDYTWDIASRHLQGVTTGPLAFSEGGDIAVKLTATNFYGCQQTVTEIIKVHAKPAINAGEDITICLGETVQLNATGADRYLWDAVAECTTCPDPVLKPTTTQTYQVTGFSDYGCFQTDNITVTVKQPIKLKVSSNASICAGDFVTLHASGAELFTWTPDITHQNAQPGDEPNENTFRIAPTTTTTYTVVGKDRHNCFSDESSITITVFPVPVINTGDDLTIKVGSAITIPTKVSADVSKILWSPGADLDCMTCPQPKANPKRTTTYKVLAENAGGCKTTDEITIQVVCNEGNLYVPNTFSPNGDQVNDRFYPRGTGIYNIKSLQVFTRWGQKVFEKYNFQANDIQKGWDGNFNGKPLNQDAYIYVMEVTCENNQIMIYKGDITLIR